VTSGFSILHIRKPRLREFKSHPGSHRLFTAQRPKPDFPGLEAVISSGSSFMPGFTFSHVSE
jgi:hypothetical protein